MMNQDDREAVLAALREDSPIIVLSHIDPDSDAFGSMCGLALALQQQGRTVACVNASGCPDHFARFPGADSISEHLPTGVEWKTAVICDCGDFVRVGDGLMNELKERQIRLVNIDHHHGNSRFGDINLVAGDVSSTSEMIALLLEEMKVPLPAVAAEALLSGIYGDTGSFRYSSTGVETFRVAGELVRSGASPEKVASSLYGSIRLAAVKLQAEALANLQLHSDGRICEVLVTDEMFQRHDATAYDTERLVEKARDIEGVLISFFIRQHEDLWKVSLRSVDEQYDVSAVATSFGGGGHKAAAAFRWRRELEELRSILLKRVQDILEAVDEPS